MEITYCLVPLLIVFGGLASVGVFFTGYTWLQKYYKKSTTSNLMLMSLVGVWGLFVFETRFVPCQGDGAVARTLNEAIKGLIHDRTSNAIARAAFSPCGCSSTTTMEFERNETIFHASDLADPRSLPVPMGRRASP